MQKQKQKRKRYKGSYRSVVLSNLKKQFKVDDGQQFRCQVIVSLYLDEKLRRFGDNMTFNIYAKQDVYRDVIYPLIQDNLLEQTKRGWYRLTDTKEAVRCLSD